MEVRRHLVGSERGTALAIGVGLAIAVLVAATEPALEPPFEPSSAGYLVVVALYGLPAVFVGAYGGGLVAGWLVEVAPAVALWLTTAGASGGQPMLVDPSEAGLGLLAAAVVLGTAGVLVGRVLRNGWDAWRG
jgi:hypothetical protein